MTKFSSTAGAAIAFAVFTLAPPLFAQQTDSSTGTAAAAPGTTLDVVHVLGFENVKRGAKGGLTVAPAALQFVNGKHHAEIGIPAIQDILTDKDSRMYVRGTTGTLAKMAIPYGGGRVVSLFAEGIDVLTLVYQDPNGGEHDVIFILHKGQASAVKKQLVAEGAHASVPPEEASTPENKQEKKP
ncbi:MAG TPA: hypothetical protein VN862_10210 [Candidatus Acidoferrales bacterium]|nr:hypothetical protein [Candidatus Acidoferrales bacterium]